MDWRYLAGAVLAAIAASALVHVLLGVWLRGALDRRLEAFRADAARELEAFRSGAARQLEALEGEASKQRALTEASADRFADVAEELVNLARNATESAIRKEELDEWHRPSQAALGADDVSEAIRGRLRRASWEAVAATSSLSAGMRKHRALIPAALEAELSSFCDRLNAKEGDDASDRKRALAAALDALESRFRESLSSAAAAPASAPAVPATLPPPSRPADGAASPAARQPRPA